MPKVRVKKTLKKYLRHLPVNVSQLYDLSPCLAFLWILKMSTLTLCNPPPSWSSHINGGVGRIKTFICHPPLGWIRMRLYRPFAEVYCNFYRSRMTAGTLLRCSSILQMMTWEHPPVSLLHASLQLRPILFMQSLERHEMKYFMT